MGERSSAPNNHYVLEQQNDVLMGELGNKVTSLKNITVDMYNDVNQQDRLLDQSHDLFGGLGHTMQSSFGRMNRMISKRHKRQMCFYVAIAVCLFFILYWGSGLIPWAASTPPDTDEGQDI